uniref:Uncharacterized protein n=1 Tax=Anopheles farauti TaxID=69004 RepID=A0A182R0Q3_9DIPT
VVVVVVVVVVVLLLLLLAVFKGFKVARNIFAEAALSFVPMPVRNVSYYHRRKYSPQAPPDHQSRIFFGDYVHPDGSSERCRSNGSIASVTPSQSSSSCVSVNSAASVADRVAAAADATNANLLSVSRGRAENETCSVPKCAIDSVVGGCAATSGSNCCGGVAGGGGGGGGGVGVGVGAGTESQQVGGPGRASVSESGAARATGCGTGGAPFSSGSVNSANISVNGHHQRRVQVSSVPSSGNCGDPPANGPLPSSTASSAGASNRTGLLLPVQPSSLAGSSSNVGPPSGGSSLSVATSSSQVSAGFDSGLRSNNEEHRLQGSPGKHQLCVDFATNI